MTDKKLPAIQYYPGDWRRDVGLRMCSIAARGLWWELMTTMHDCEPYGHLAVNGKPLSDDQAAESVRVPVKEYKKLLKELEENGVFSRTESGIIYSRRMVRDEEVRNRKRLGGHAGAEHGVKGGRRMREQPDETNPTEGFPKETPPRGFRKNPPSVSASAAVSSSASTAVSKPVEPVLDSARDPADRGLADPIPDDVFQDLHEFKVQLVVAANSGLREIWGERLFLNHGHAGSIKCAEALHAAGVDHRFAIATVRDYARSLGHRSGPPSSLNFFTDHVLDRWKAQNDAPGAATADDAFIAFAIDIAREGSKYSAEYQAILDSRNIEWRRAS